MGDRCVGNPARRLIMDSPLILPGDPVFDLTLEVARPPRQGENIEGDYLALTQGDDGLLYWVDESEFDGLLDRAIEDPLLDDDLLADESDVDDFSGYGDGGDAAGDLAHPP